MRQPEQENPVYLGDILDCINNIEAYTHQGETEFLTSKLIQDAVIRNFEIIGEATKWLSPELRQTYPEIPWRQMAGFRDILIHSYMSINIATVWQAVQELPQLQPKLQTILQSIVPQSRWPTKARYSRRKTFG